MNVWRLVAHHEARKEAIRWFRETSRIAMGWGNIEDLRRLDPVDASAIILVVREEYTALRNAHLGGPSLWRFYREMAIGDLVIVGDGHNRQLVMKVTGSYEWSRAGLSVLGDYYHQRTAEVVALDPDELWSRCGGKAPGENIRWTLARCKEPNGAEDLGDGPFST